MTSTSASFSSRRARHSRSSALGEWQDVERGAIRCQSSMAAAGNAASSPASAQSAGGSRPDCSSSDVDGGAPGLLRRAGAARVHLRRRNPAVPLHGLLPCSLDAPRKFKDGKYIRHHDAADKQAGYDTISKARTSLVKRSPSAPSLLVKRGYGAHIISPMRPVARPRAAMRDAIGVVSPYCSMAPESAWPSRMLAEASVSWPAQEDSSRFGYHLQRSHHPACRRAAACGASGKKRAS